MYLTYEEYQSMGGGLDEVEFTRLCKKACKRLDHITFNRLKGLVIISDDVKDCVYELIGLLKEQEGLQSTDASAAQVARQSNDGVSVSYNIIGAESLNELLENKIDDAVKLYLGDVKDAKGRRITYRGIYPDE